MTEHERQVVGYRLGFVDDYEPKTLEAIAQIMGITRERVRQIESKSYRVLRRPESRDILLNGYANYLEIKKVKEALYQESIKKHCEEYRANAIDTQEISAFSLDKLGLSCRSYNCLRRADVETLDDFMELTKEKLMTIRNLGVRSLREIQEKQDDIRRGNMEWLK